MRDRKLWTWHLLAGAVIAVFLGLHMIIMHLSSSVGIFNTAGSKPVAWGNVLSRSGSLFFTVGYIVLLAAALFHGLYGFRNILFELSPSAGLKKAINVLFILGGLALFAFGTWAAVAGYQLAQVG
jgi:succinate dehydrogenase / fumarate reductase membrane anchor subunit